MPATDGLQPPLSPGEQAVVKSFGGWTSFMRTYGFKAHDQNDIQAAYSIVQQMAKHDADDAKAGKKK